VPNLVWLLLSTRGRLGRRPYGLAVFGLALTQFTLGRIPVIGAASTLVLLWPWLCLVAKRLHDQGRSGVLAMIPVGMASGVGLLSLGLVALAANPVTLDTMIAFSNVAATVTALVGAICLAFVVWVGAGRGQFGANRYGRPRPFQTGPGNLFSPK
jgi:uncharacterized membrane protein YhaH (DUF805 family)